MQVVKEYLDGKTKIRIHSDYIEAKEQQVFKEIIISLVINFLKNQDSDCNNCSEMVKY